jgi:hypothetical protein
MTGKSLADVEPAPAKHTSHLLKWEEQFLPEDNGMSNGIWISYVKNGQPVASFVNTSEWDKKLADLFTAAPETAAERDRLKKVNQDLLEALKEVLSEIQALVDDGTLRECDVNNHLSIIKARAAIAKATMR